MLSVDMIQYAVGKINLGNGHKVFGGVYAPIVPGEPYTVILRLGTDTSKAAMEHVVKVLENTLYENIKGITVQTSYIDHIITAYVSETETLMNETDMKLALTRFIAFRPDLEVLIGITENNIFINHLDKAFITEKVDIKKISVNELYKTILDKIESELIFDQDTKKRVTHKNIAELYRVYFSDRPKYPNEMVILSYHVRKINGSLSIGNRVDIVNMGNKYESISAYRPILPNNMDIDEYNEYRDEILVELNKKKE